MGKAGKAEPTTSPVWAGPREHRDHLMPAEALVINPENPNDHSDPGSIPAIMASLLEYGQQKPIVVNADGVVLAGNGTLEAARQMGWTHLWAVQSDLDGVQADGYAIADNEAGRFSRAHPQRTAALLQRIRDNGGNVDATGYGDGRMEELLASLRGGVPMDGDGDGDKYLVKFETPCYEPSGECPPVSMLLDRSRADALIADVDAAMTSGVVEPEIARFLRNAAERHAVFDYQQIADFYAHAEPEVQRLFEASALVIVDVEAAIEGGFVRLSSRMLNLCQEEIDARAEAAGDEDED